MFIFDEPFVSDLAIKTVNSNNFDVFENSIVKDKASNLFSKNNLKKIFNERKKIYTNSENSLDVVLSELKNTELIEWVKLFKDKVQFRKFLKTIYPDFYYKEVLYDELDSINQNELKYPLVIKPSVGFLSFGVYTIYTPNEFKNVVKKIKESMKNAKGLFPESVLNSNSFIIEDFIDGDEFAIDVYFDDQSKPVILNIFHHPFFDAFDVSDRIYLTSAKIVNDNYDLFFNLLEKIGNGLKLKNFPMHIEVRKNGNNVIPIEVNPLRFAGWCTCDLAYYAYGINIYEYFEFNKTPDWKKIYENNKNTYAFIMGEVPPELNKSDIISFDIEAFKKDTNAEILDTREFDFRVKPMFCVLFVKAEDGEKLKHVLEIDMKKYIKMNGKNAI